jgi:hypothetical protein
VGDQHSSHAKLAWPPQLSVLQYLWHQPTSDLEEEEVQMTGPSVQTQLKAMEW